jgi:hypothetical protein
LSQVLKPFDDTNRSFHNSRTSSNRAARRVQVIRRRKVAGVGLRPPLLLQRYAEQRRAADAAADDFEEAADAIPSWMRGVWRAFRGGGHRRLPARRSRRRSPSASRAAAARGGAIPDWRPHRSRPGPDSRHARGHGCACAPKPPCCTAVVVVAGPEEFLPPQLIEGRARVLEDVKLVEDHVGRRHAVDLPPDTRSRFFAERGIDERHPGAGRNAARAWRECLSRARHQRRGRSRASGRRTPWPAVRTVSIAGDHRTRRNGPCISANVSMAK